MGLDFERAFTLDAALTAYTRLASRGPLLSAIPCSWGTVAGFSLNSSPPTTYPSQRRRGFSWLVPWHASWASFLDRNGRKRNERSNRG
jgi:hypothetical protein